MEAFQERARKLKEFTDPTKLFISNIPFKITKTQFTRFISKYGRIRKVVFLKNQKTKFSGNALVTFLNAKDARKVLEEESLILNERKLKVAIAERQNARKGEVSGENNEVFDKVSLSMGYWIQERIFVEKWKSQNLVTAIFSKGRRKLELEWDPYNKIESDSNNQEYSSLFDCIDTNEIADMMRELLDISNKYIVKIGFKDIEENIIFKRTKENLIAYLQLKNAPRIFLEETQEDFTTKTRVIQSHFGMQIVKLVFPTPSNEQEQLKSFFESMSRFQITEEFLKFHNVEEIEEPSSSRISSNRLLTFDIQTRIESLISKRILYGTNLDNEFYKILADKKNEVQKWILLRFESNQKRIFDPLGFLKSINNYPTSFPKSSNGLMTRRVVVTPLRTIINFPMEEVSNRIIRQYSQYADRFLRVSFTDENLKKISRPSKEILKRIREFLNGITIAGEKFEFLAFSSSQLREHSCWFFASDENLSASDIRKNMEILKFPPNMEQEWDNVSLLHSVENHVMIPDIEIKDPQTGKVKYTFSDGIGKISSEFAKKVSSYLGLSFVPSAFQIRYKGCKGVVAVDPTFKGEIAIRKSMKKFEADNTRNLEVISWSKYMPCYLNRQVISILSTLGVKDEIFEKMQTAQLNELEKMSEDPDTAIKLLHRCHSDLGITSTLIQMIKSGVSIKDPFIEVNLTLLKARLTKDFRKKSRVFVHKGVCLIGVLDETNTLKYGEIFFQFQDRDGNNPGPMKGKVTTAKMPAFHPGDVRILEAVDVPELHHLVNVVVFPAVGKRPHPNECSGSDLDGDIYWLSWDPNLIPPQLEEPGDYSAAEPQTVNVVTIEHIKDFVEDYIENDNLGVIANMHLAISDASPLGVKDKDCLLLASLHSTAVDFPKTGIKAEIPNDLKVGGYPTFMENKKRSSRESQKVIGKMYEEVKKFQSGKKDQYHIQRSHLELDEELLSEGYQSYIELARVQRDNYFFELQAIMNQYGIRSEMEAVSGNIMKCCFSKRPSDIRDIVLRLVHSLRKRTKDEFELQCKDFDISEKKAFASAMYWVCYYKKEETKCVSFAWIAYEYLCNMKKMENSWNINKIFTAKKE